MPVVAQKWIESGMGLELPAGISTGFDRYLSSLPWLAARLDWSRMPTSVRIGMSAAADVELREWLRTTRLGLNHHMVVWYSERVGGIVVSTDIGIVNLDVLYRETPGIRYCFGINASDGEMDPHFGDLLQYGGGDALVAVALQ
jgi:hypothetical protein